MESRKKTDKTKGNKVLKISLKVLKIMLVLGVLVGFLGGGVVLGMVAASLRDVPALERDRLENPSLPTLVVSRDGELMRRIYDENRIRLNFDEFPKDLINAFLATEDRTFFEHPGFDIRGLGRAVLTNVQGNMVVGGSTITQQLVKQEFLHQGKVMDRKIQELYLALQVEKMYTKEEIMEFYLNSAVHYAGDERGVGAAANALFGKKVDELTLSEMALLAGIPNWPSQYDPRLNMEAATQRRNYVLSRMYNSGYITQAQLQEAREEEIQLRRRGNNNGDEDNATVEPFRYFGPSQYALNEAAKILVELYGFSRTDAEHAIRNHGYTITTTINLEHQRLAEDVINDDSHFVNKYKGPGQQEEASATLIDVKTGEIVALVTGRNSHPSHNSVLRHLSVRSPGSSIKPIIAYGPAIEQRIMFPGSVLDDAPIIRPGGNQGPYTPTNYNSTRFKGLVTMRDALVVSDNIPAILALETVGLRTAADFAFNLGLSQFTSLDLAAAVGGKNTTALELTSAYSAFANNGVLVDHHIIKEITDRNGRVIYTSEPQSKVVMSEETSFLITNMLQEVITRGTGTAVRQHFTRPAAAKTGTSNNGRDVWLVGYTPQYALGVWVGWDEGTVNSERNNHRAIWGKIMAGVHKDLPTVNFPSAPRNVVQVAVSTKSGKLPSPLTPSEFIKTDYFVRGYEPTEVCDAFVEVTICRETGLLATDSCPPHHRQTKVMLAPREYLTTTSEWPRAGIAPDDVEMMAPTEDCDMHDGSGASAPSGLASDLTTNGIRLRWNASGDFAGYNVYRKSPDTEFTLLNSTPINVREFLDTTVSKDVEYSYYVTAVNRDGGETRPSSTIKVTYPTAVQGVTNFELEYRNNEVRIRWDAAINATNYKVFRSTQENSGFTEIESTSKLSFVDKEAKKGNTYYYYIVAEGAPQSQTKSIALPGNGNGNGNGNGDDNGDGNGD